MANLLLTFGGQGSEYLDELRAVCREGDIPSQIVTAASATLLAQLTALRTSEPSAADRYFAEGLDVVAWSSSVSAADAPSAAYLRSAPVSFPLICVTQLAQFAASVIRLGYDSPAALLEGCAGATGHSQGVVAAAVAAGAKTWAQLEARTATATALLFWQGLRIQQASDALRCGGAGASSPMLAVSGLREAELRKELDALNRDLRRRAEAEAELAATAAELAASAAGGAAAAAAPPRAPAPLGDALTLGLVNGCFAAVCSGRATHVAALHARLEKLRLQPGAASQARVPSSQRAPAITLRYLRVSAPFHCPLLESAAAAAAADCARHGIAFERGELAVPVWATDDGRDLRAATGAAGGDAAPTLAAELIALQAVRPMRWTTVLDPASARLRGVTRVLDCGPGGAAGAVRLAAKLLQGAGVLVAVAGALPLAAGADASSAPAGTSAPELAKRLLLEPGDGPDALPLYAESLFTRSAPRAVLDAALAAAPHWVRASGARIVRRPGEGEGCLLLDTAYTRLTGRPPVLVGGMTPTTSLLGGPLVAACLRAGFTAELAAGGLPRPSIFRESVAALHALLPPGEGICINMLYLNARQWGMQFPLALEMRREGVPIEGITIGAGVPSPDAAAEIVAQMRAAGLRYLGLKPGSEEALLGAVAIARAVEPFPIVVQWTGGRAGGHHSFEDAFAPLAAAYPAIRAVPSIVLVAGSGVGSASSALPWLDGSWATSRGLSAVRMPADAVLLASRMMVAAEAATSPEVKRLIVATPGLPPGADEAAWEASYKGVAGGILTVRSELGEPIHKVANRGMRLWRELDERFFALPRGEARSRAVAEHRTYIIRRLNADFQKVYFGLPGGASGAPYGASGAPSGSSGAPSGCVDPEHMTYAEVAARMVELMFVPPERELPRGGGRPHVDAAAHPHGRWVDRSFRDRVFRFLERAEHTLSDAAPDAPRAVASPAQLEPAPGAAPGAWVAGLFAPGAALQAGRERVLSAQDFDAWLEDCRSGGKPVPFVPVVDGELEVWFKKDSLWYSEDLAAVPDRDPDRVCILQGPVAAAFSDKADEPAAAILSGVHDGVVAALIAQGAPEPSPAAPPAYIGGAFELPAEGPAATTAAAAPWLSALLQAPSLVELSPGSPSASSASSPGGWRLVPNPWPRILAPGPGWIARVSADALHIVPAGAAAGGEGPLDAAAARISAVFDAAQAMVRVSIRDDVPSDAPRVLSMRLRLLPRAAAAPLAYESDEWEAAVRAHYRSMWFGPGDAEPAEDALAPLDGSYTLTEDALSRFVLATQQPLLLLPAGSGGDPSPQALAPASFSIVACWRALIGALFAGAVRGNLLSLVHLSHEFAAPEGARHGQRWPRSGDAISSRLYITEVAILPSGSQRVTVAGSLCVAPQAEEGGAAAASAPAPSPWVDVRSSFLFRGSFRDYAPAFRRSPPAGEEFTLSLRSAADVAVLCSKAWFRRALQPVQAGWALDHAAVDTPPVDADAAAAAAPVELSVGDVLIFRLHILERPADAASLARVSVRGAVTRIAAARKSSSAAAAGPRPAATRGRATLAPAMALAGGVRHGMRASESVASLISMRSAVTEPPLPAAAAAPGGDDAAEGPLTVGSVEFEWPPPASEGSVAAASRLTGNPVTSFLRRAAAAVGGATDEQGGDVVALEGGPRALIASPDEISTPLSNVPYALASLDLNPIHRDAAIAELAGLPGTITHGMWTSANGLRVLLGLVDAELEGSKGGGKLLGASPAAQALVRRYAADFVGMVLPGDRLVTQINHVGMHAPSGHRVLVVETYAIRAAAAAAADAAAGADESPPPPPPPSLVLRATCHVAVPPTAFVFTGQGSAAKGMGMDLYASSPVAKRVWDEADAHLSKTYGFSILTIVRENPSSLTVHFGGRRGAAVRRNFMALEVEAPDGSGSIRLLPGITEDTPAYTFVHPGGLLFATQFTQPALVLVEKAAFDDMRAHALIPHHALFAGHSLGEYAALASVVELLRVAGLVSLVFLRGMVMQGAVPRDELGRSDFGMVACNPSRVGPFLNDRVLAQLVQAISKHSGGNLLEVVNHNVVDRQYVVAGQLRALDILGQTLSLARKEPALARDPPALLTRAFAVTEQRVAAAAAAGAKLALEQGEATIPLPGIDVPFHSRFLLGGVPGFRNVLRKQLTLDALRAPGMVGRLVGCYVPNLVALPFRLDRYFAAEVLRVTGSPVLGRLLDSDAAWAAAAADTPSLARTLVIELLAYQFASPVQWIATQHLFFSGCVQAPVDAADGRALVAFPADAVDSPALPPIPQAIARAGAGPETTALPAPVPGVRRVIEIGPTATLVGMALRTLQTGRYAAPEGRALLFYGKDADQLYYREEEAEGAAYPSAADAAAALQSAAIAAAEAAAAAAASAAAAAAVAAAARVTSSEVVSAIAPAPIARDAPAPPPVAPRPAPAAAAPAPRAAPSPAPARAPRPAAGAAASPDAPASSLEVLQALVSVKLGVEIAAVKADASLKALTGGKSAVMNELLGDVEKEFGSSHGQEGAAEMPLSELARSLGASYKPLGKVSSALVAKALAAKLPGGFSSSDARGYLSSAHGAGSGRTDAVLVHAVTMQPAKRLESEAAAKAWLDASVASYCALRGVVLAPSCGSSGVAADDDDDVGDDYEEEASGGGAAAAPAMEDAPASSLEVLQALTSAKLGVEIASVKADASLKALTGGKSAVMNELLGDVEKEFGSSHGQEGAAEMPLSELARSLGASYKPLGKVSSALVAKALAAKLPGGFSSSDARAYLAAAHGLGPGRTDGLLLHAVTMQPAKRLESEAAAKTWLDSSVTSYCALRGITAAPARRAGGGTSSGRRRRGGGRSRGGGGGGGSSGVPSAAFTQLQQRLLALASDSAAAFQAFAGEDAWAPQRRLQATQAQAGQSEAALATWRAELGDAFEAGIQPVFSAPKQRVYRSVWAWGTQSLLQLIAAAKRSPTAAAALASPAAAQLALARASPEHAVIARAALALPSVAAQPRVAALLALVAAAPARAAAPPPVRIWLEPTAPRTTITAAGRVAYAEAPRPGVSSARAFVAEMARGAAASYLRDLVGSSSTSSSSAAASASTTGDFVVGSPVMSPLDRPAATAAPDGAGGDEVPFVHLRSVDPGDSGSRVLDPAATRRYFQALLACCGGGEEEEAAAAPAAVAAFSFSGKTALVTGCGPGSIGAQLVAAMLGSGAHVIATTSRLSRASTRHFQALFQAAAAPGAQLTLLPYNAGSAQDTAALVAHIYGPLGADLDFIVPFAAVSEAGASADALTGANEVAHRVMLTNVLRLVGHVVDAKRRAGRTRNPALALLPLSPNHGVFGGDGLYAESKLGLEALCHKWGSEGWGDYVSIAGAVIGWTRGTGLMAESNVVSEGVEQLGCRTFSQAEMAFCLTALLHPLMVRQAATAPVWADLRGGFHAVPDLKAAVAAVREAVEAEAALVRALAADAAAEVRSCGLHANVNVHALESGAPEAATATAAQPASRPGAAKTPSLVNFPPLPSEAQRDELAASTGLRGPADGTPGSPELSLVDLDSTVVVAGFGELGPWGFAATRWEAETLEGGSGSGSGGRFSPAGCVLLAWLTGRIRYAAGGATGGAWVDAASGEALAGGAAEVKARFEADMLVHAGIRVVEPALCDGYDPARKPFFHAVALDRDQASWVEVSGEEQAAEFVAALGVDRVDVRPAPAAGGGAPWHIRLRKGATIAVPRAVAFDRWVAGLVPTGFDARRLGLPADIAARVDPVAHYTLAATAEALLSAGLPDPYELFSFVHVSAVGNATGGGMGGMQSMRRIFRDRYHEGDMPSDVLQETFINSVPAWVNMLLLSASGPILTPVGACATAAESVAVAVDTIRAGKAAVMLAGGFDDFGEEGSFEFAQMGATSSAAAEAAAGREPSEMCRPMAPTRAGFMEAQGAGVQVLMTARLALAMGAPIYGVVAHASTATDQAGRSIPAPGQGILTTAREAARGAGEALSRVLDPAYRRRRLARDLAAAATWAAEEEAEAAAEAAAAALAARSSEAAEGAEAAGSGGSAVAALAVARRIAEIAHERAHLERSARRAWCLDFAGSAGAGAVAPLRAALAAWGLGPDDITLGSFHGTGTQANDVNESDVTHAQLAHLGRSPGRPLLVVAQKHLTGHPKGAAAAWMVNGALQSLATGIVPGNANADDVDDALRRFSHLAYPSAPLRLGPGGVRSALVKSFGFGQAGGEALLVHADVLLAALPRDVFARYAAARAVRERRAYRHGQEILAGRAPLLPVKDAPPFSPAQAQAVYLDPSARVRWDAAAARFRFHDEDLPLLPKGRGAAAAPSPPAPPASTAVAVREAAAATTAAVAAAVAATATARGASPGSAAAPAPALARGVGPAVGVGVDVEPVATFSRCIGLGADDGGTALLARNFTAAEADYCAAAPAPAESLAGRWAAKEAVVKALCSALPAVFGSAGAGAPLSEIEVVARASAAGVSGAPGVVFHGRLLAAAVAAGLDPAAAVRLSISHTAALAVAVAIVQAP